MDVLDGLELHFYWSSTFSSEDLIKYFISSQVRIDIVYWII